MSSGDLLAKVDAILEKSRKLAADPRETKIPKYAFERPEADMGRYQVFGEPNMNTEARTTNRSKIFAAMADHKPMTSQAPMRETQPLNTPNAMAADLVSLAARYSTELQKTAAQGYRNKVDLETLESARNDWRMKAEILERRLTNEGQRLIEKEATLSKVDHCYQGRLGMRVSGSQRESPQSRVLQDGC